MIGKVLGVLCLLCDERGGILLVLGVLAGLVRKELLRNLSEYGHRLGTLMCPHLGL